MITAEEESNKVVTTIPTNIPEKVFDVNLRIHLLALSPITDLMVSERLLTAYKKRTNPASIDNNISVIILYKNMQEDKELSKMAYNANIKYLLRLEVIDQG
jgi:hypothetical protein